MHVITELTLAATLSGSLEVIVEDFDLLVCFFDDEPLEVHCFFRVCTLSSS